MNIKYCRPAKDGTHTFSQYRDFSLVDQSIIVEMRPFGSEYINSFKYDLYDFTKEEDKTRIFFISEYAKRKFFLDCNVKKDNNGTYSKICIGKSKKYEYKIYDNEEDVLSDVLKMFLRNPGMIGAFRYNYELDKSIYAIKAKNPYEYIQILHKIILDKVICSLSKPTEEDLKRNATETEQEYILEFSKEEHSIFEYERIIYNASLSQFPSRSSCTIAAVTNYIMRLLGYSHAFIIFKNIVDDYHLYISELFNLTDMKMIISSNYAIQELPHFFFLVKEIPIDDKYEDYIHCQFIPSKREINISIDFHGQNFDSIEVANHVRNQVILALFAHKADLKMKYSELEAKTFCEYINTDSKRNEKNNCKTRSNALYLWDRIHIYEKNASIRENFQHIHKEINEDMSDSTIRKYHRYVSATCESIENRTLRPMS